MVWIISKWINQVRFKQQYKEVSPPIRMSSGKFISIQGNIGSGKSTILRVIRENFPELKILDQPLASWEKVGEKQNINLLGMYYDDPKRWGFTFQIYAFMTRLKKWTEFSNMDSNNNEIKISERSLLSDRYVFASIMHDMEILNEAEYQIYLQCYRDMLHLNKIAKVQGIIYIQCDPSTCSTRIQKRAREGESSIPIDYLQKLHQKHESWLNPTIRPCSQDTQSSNNSSIQEENIEDTIKVQNQQQLQKEQIFEEELFSELEQNIAEQPQQVLIYENEQKKQTIFEDENAEKSKIEFLDKTAQSSTITTQMQNPENSSSLSSNNEKVLIIDNTVPIDKARLISQISNWLALI